MTLDKKVREELDEVISYMEKIMKMPPSRRKLLHLMGKLRCWLGEGAKLLEEFQEFLKEEGG